MGSGSEGRARDATSHLARLRVRLRVQEHELVGVGVKVEVDVGDWRLEIGGNNYEWDPCPCPW